MHTESKLTTQSAADAPVDYTKGAKVKWLDPYARTRKRVSINERRIVRWADAKVKERHGGVYTSVFDDTFYKICAVVFDLPRKHHKLFYNWLGVFFGEDAVPPPPNAMGVRFPSPWEGGKHAPLKVGSKFPRPQGPSWQQWIQAYDRDIKAARLEVAAARIIGSLEDYTDFANTLGVPREERLEHVVVRQALCGEAQHGDEWCEVLHDNDGKLRYETGEELARACKVSAKAYKEFMGDSVTQAEVDAMTDDDGCIPDPEDWEDVRKRPKAEQVQWAKAKKIELDAIIAHEVLSKPMNAKERSEMGVDPRRSTPLRMLYTIKKTPLNTLDKFKCRMVLLGSPKYLRRGRDYWATFSATPVQVTSRIMQFLVVQLNMKRDAADVVCAYLNGTLKREERQGVKLDKELRTYDPKTREELQPITLNALYGHPASGRRYAECRDALILGDEFNFSNAKEKWSSRRARYDPALFVMTHFMYPKHPNFDKLKRAGVIGMLQREDQLRGQDEVPSDEGMTDKIVIESSDDVIISVALLSAYVDDLDLVYMLDDDKDYIWGVLDKRFGLKRGNVEHMLGLTREISDDGATVTIGMSGYIESMMEKFKGKVGTKKRTTPVPPGLYLSNENAPTFTEKEKKRRQTELLEALGMVMWCGRMVHLECSYGINTVCRMVANPTDAAIEAVYHLIGYLYGVKDQGITFKRVAGTPKLVCFYDASNKGDPADGDKAQAGFIVFLGTGPVDWRSFRLTHVGLSAQHNEYMSLAHASQAVLYVRYLLEDMGLGHWVSEPTVILGDNDAATTLAREDRLTIQNRFYSRLCHFAKECYEKGLTDPRRVGTDDNVSDGMTKALGRQVIEAHFEYMFAQRALPTPPPPPRD